MTVFIALYFSFEFANNFVRIISLKDNVPVCQSLLNKFFREFIKVTFFWDIFVGKQQWNYIKVLNVDTELVTTSSSLSVLNDA